MGTRPRPFEEIVTAHGAAVLRVCRAVVGPTDAEDVWSETFLAALRAYPSLRPNSHVEGWLVTIAHRKALDHLRAAARRPVPTDPLPEPRVRGRRGAGGASAAVAATAAAVWEALRTLPLKQRQSIAYHHLAGLGYREVALIAGGTEAAARRAAADGMVSLRRALRSRKGATR